jgi:hypothetical protein
MTFINVSLLAGAAAITIPIVLHLIMRRKPKLFEFPALRFIQKRHDRNQRRLRLRHLLLLLLRAGAIALLAFALARPSVKFSGRWSRLGSQDAPVAAALIFDAAPHMQYKHENQTRLEIARDMGRKLLSQLPAESQIAVLDTSNVPRTFDADRGVSKQRIDRLEVVNNSQPLITVVGNAGAVLKQSELDRKEIYVFTDLSRPSWPAEAGTTLQDRLRELPGVAVYVIDLGVAEPSNFALGQVRLSSQVVSKGGAVEIQTDVSCFGQGGERTIELNVYDAEGKPQKRGEKVVSLKPGPATSLQFRLGDLGTGIHQGFLRILGQDGLAADDTRYFTVEVGPAWPVLVVAGRPVAQHAHNYVAAVAPAELRRRGQARFECQIIDFEELAKQPLEKFAGVVLLDPPRLEPGVWKKLADFTAEGHGLAIFLGRSADPESFNTPVAQQLLPGKLTLWARRPDGDTHLAPADYQHPVLRAFKPWAANIPWAAFPVFYYWAIADRQEGTAVVVAYNDDGPALLERPVGSGRVLTMTTPISDPGDRNAWNLLPFSYTVKAWPFVGLMNELTTYLVGGGQQQLNYFAGQTVVLPLDEQARRRTYILSKPDGVKNSIEPRGQELSVGPEEAGQAGDYRVQSGGKAVDRGFSVNLSPDQTRLDRIDEAQFVELFGPFRPNMARTLDQLDRATAVGRVGRDLYPPAIFFLAVLLGMEYVVANQFYKEA